jgi:hypothetical protein
MVRPGCIGEVAVQTGVNYFQGVFVLDIQLRDVAARLSLPERTQR